MKKDDSKSNITTECIEYKHKNTRTSSCKFISISKLQHQINSSMKCWKTVSLKPSFGLSVERWSWLSRLVCFNWLPPEVFTSFPLEKNLWTYDKPDIVMHENNILWEVTIPKYTVYKKSHTCEEGGAHLGIYFWYLLMNLTKK